MKRVGNFFNKIAEMDNLQLAFFKAQKGKTCKRDVIQFRKRLTKNLLSLRDDILSSNITVGNYKRFFVYEPKKREICTVPFYERVLQHAIVNLCEPRFEAYQIETSYACRKEKGIDGAMKKARDYSGAFSWYLKLDVHRYFDSVDHVVLQKILERLFKDSRLLELFWKIIDSYQTVPGRGIPIGNLTSQYFANIYLSTLDHYIKEQLNISGYVRYMDDFVLFANCKEELQFALERVNTYLTERLNLTLNEPQLNRCKCGLTYLGYRLYPEKTKLSQRSKKRFRKKIRVAESNLRTDIWTQCEYARHVSPLIAFLQRADCKGFLKSVPSSA